MAMKMILDTLDGLDEKLHAEYEERDGKFYLIVDDIESSPVFAKLKNNEQAARRAERALAAKISAWEKLGKTEDEIAALIESAEKAAVAAAEGKGEWDKLKNQMNERHLRELEAKDKLTAEERKKVERLKGQIEKHIVDSAATAAIAAARGVPELLLPIVKRFVKTTEDETTGEFSTSIVNEKGEPRVNAKGEPLTMDELLAEMKSSEKLGRAFEGSGAAGAGSAPGGGGGGGGRQSSVPAGTPKSWAEAKTPEEKAAWIKHSKTLQPAK